MEVFFSKADEILNLVTAHSPLWIYLFVFVSMLIENFFPPYPGDTIVFICGVYAAGGNASWWSIYGLSVIGTLASVMALYYFGRTHGRSAFSSHSMRWLGVRRLEHVDHWFDRWHDKVLLASRYLTGVRALIAVMAGVGRVGAWRMLIYSTISTLTWNFIVLYLALRLRLDWHKIDAWLATYNSVIIAALLIVLAFVAYKIVQRRRRRENA